MSAEQLEGVEGDRLGAAVLEQRRLAHMLRQRGAEIDALEASRERLAARERQALEREEALRRKLRDLEARVSSLDAEVVARTDERDRISTELKEAQYETRRAGRRFERGKEEAAASLARAERDAAEERQRAERRLEEARVQLSSLAANRDSIVAELREAQYEARRAERRRAKANRDAAEARSRASLQLDALRAELQQGLSSRDQALADRHRALEAVEEMQVAATETQAAATELALGVEASALELGRTQRELELLVGLEREREILLANSGHALDEVAGHLRRVRVSRSWRWGHAIARALRKLGVRGRSKRSALDSALLRLGDDEQEPAPD